MFYALISFLGLIIGLVLSKKFKSELKDIQKFLKFVVFILIMSIILRLLLLINFSYLFLSGMIIGAVVNYFLRYNYLYFGFILMLANLMNELDQIFFSISIFILGLSYNALIEANKKNIIIIIILFALPFGLLFTNLASDYFDFLSGVSIGGLAVGFKQFNK